MSRLRGDVGFQQLLRSGPGNIWCGHGGALEERWNVTISDRGTKEAVRFFDGFSSILFPVKKIS
jgi:hypothetical protein